MTAPTHSGPVDRYGRPLLTSTPQTTTNYSASAPVVPPVVQHITVVHHVGHGVFSAPPTGVGHSTSSSFPPVVRASAQQTTMPPVVYPTTAPGPTHHQYQHVPSSHLGSSPSHLSSNPKDKPLFPAAYTRK